MKKLKLYNVNIDVSDIEDDNLYMRFSTYEREIKDTPIVSTPSEGPVVDMMEILMNGITK